MPKNTPTSGVSLVTGGTRAEIVENQSFEILDERRSNLLFKNLMQEVDTPDETSNFDLKIRKFLELVKLFMTNGRLFPKPNEFASKILETKNYGSYAEFEDWILQKANKPYLLNFLHEHWLYQGPASTQFSITEKERLKSWIWIFLDFERFSFIRPQVIRSKSSY